MINIPNLKEKLAKADEVIEISSDNEQINKILEDIIIDITDAEHASIWIYDSKVLIREREAGITRISMEDKEGLLYKCFATKKASIENYLSSTKGYVAHVDNPDNIRIKSKIMIPIVIRDVFLGIVTAYASVRKIKNFKRNDLEIFKAIMPFIVDAIAKMNTNNGKELKIERRSKGSKDTGERRRKSDVDVSLETFEEKRTESTTDNTDDMLGQVSNIVHDIRTPANGLLGFLEILEDKIEDKRLKEYISNAKKSASYISELTTSILEGVSSNNAPISSDIETISSMKFFSEIAEIFSADMYKKEIDYIIYLDPQLPRELQLDTIKMKRVIINLIGNANKFTPVNGKVEFSVKYNQKDEKLQIFIEDSGIGIAKEKQDEIFEAFKQAEEDTKENYGGTGLGLTICAEYVKTLGGQLRLDSELDKGSIFYFDIPVDVKDETTLFTPIKKENIIVSILCEKENMPVVNNIAKYMIYMGINVNNIKAVTKVEHIVHITTYVVVFENKINQELLESIIENKQKLLIVEEDFLSLNINDYTDAMLISQYGFYGNAIYNYLNTSEKSRVLIVDDDKISTMLLQTMLEDEYCDMDVASDGEEGKTLLLEALRMNRPYKIVYTDHNMPKKSGSDMLRDYISEEKKKRENSIITVCISGDSANNDALYAFDYWAMKPFKKQEIISLLDKVNN